MKTVLATISLVISTSIAASEPAIEPVLLPLIDKQKDINIQMAKYEVTVKEFNRFVKATNYSLNNDCHVYSEKHIPRHPIKEWRDLDSINQPYQPMVCINTKDAMAYTKWLSKETGKPYRLPSFKEWQLAATAGKSSRFAFGEDFEHNDICHYENIEDVAHMAGMKRYHNIRDRYSIECNDGAVFQTVVGMYRPNPLGFHDMMGNVRERLGSCYNSSSTADGSCQSYDIAGGAWHWIPRPVETRDTLPFNGSIEGFRLVLDSDKQFAMSHQTKQFLLGLEEAQASASMKHQAIKSIPAKLSAVQARLISNKKVALTWQSNSTEKVTYSVYRSYVDPENKLSRRMTKVAESIIENSYIDELPGIGDVSYLVYSENKYGESLPSNEAFVSKANTFKVGDKIQAESYFHYRNARVYQDESQQTVLLTANEGYYPPSLMPYTPAWMTYRFSQSEKMSTNLTLNIRGEQGSIVEFWQGRHLVAKLTLENSSAFKEHTIAAVLHKSDEPIEIKNGNKAHFELDWFKFSH